MDCGGCIECMVSFTSEAAMKSHFANHTEKRAIADRHEKKVPEKIVNQEEEQEKLMVSFTSEEGTKYHFENDREKRAFVDRHDAQKICKKQQEKQVVIPVAEKNMNQLERLVGNIKKQEEEEVPDAEKVDFNIYYKYGIMIYLLLACIVMFNRYNNETVSSKIPSAFHNEGGVVHYHHHEHQDHSLFLGGIVVLLGMIYAKIH